MTVCHNANLTGLQYQAEHERLMTEAAAARQADTDAMQAAMERPESAGPSVETASSRAQAVETPGLPHKPCTHTRRAMPGLLAPGGSIGQSLALQVQQVQIVGTQPGNNKVALVPGATFSIQLDFSVTSEESPSNLGQEEPPSVALQASPGPPKPTHDPEDIPAVAATQQYNNNCSTETCPEPPASPRPGDHAPTQSGRASPTKQTRPLPTVEPDAWSFSALPPTVPKHKHQKNLYQVGGMYPRSRGDGDDQGAASSDALLQQACKRPATVLEPTLHHAARSAPRTHTQTTTEDNHSGHSTAHTVITPPALPPAAPHQGQDELDLPDGWGKEDLADHDEAECGAGVPDEQQPGQ